MDKVRWIRVLSFATIYFFIYVISFTVYFLYLIKLHLTVYSFTLEYLLQNPWVAFRIIFRELTRSPLSLFIIILCSFIMGFITDWILRILLRKRKQKTEFNHPKT